MSKAQNEYHKKLLRQFHTLCREIGMSNEEKEAMIRCYGVESSADIPEFRLRMLCDKLAKQVSPHIAEMDKLRKGVIKSICKWLELSGMKSNAEIAKGIACRSTKYTDFNKIPPERLRNIYYNFCNKQQDKIAAEKLMAEILAHTTALGSDKSHIVN